MNNDHTSIDVLLHFDEIVQAGEYDIRASRIDEITILESESALPGKFPSGASLRGNERGGSPH